MAYKPVFHANSALLDSFFYAYSTTVDRSVIFSFCLDKYYISQ